MRRRCGLMTTPGKCVTSVETALDGVGETALWWTTIREQQ